jgi:hypothetical protein
MRRRGRFGVGAQFVPQQRCTGFRCVQAFMPAKLQLRAATFGGVAVHEAARIMAAAAPDEILVSETIPALVSGLGLKFAERGEQELKGFGSRRLFAFDD